MTNARIPMCGGLSLGVRPSFVVRHSGFAIVALFLALSCTASHAAELHWQNAEWIGGDFVGAEADHVSWRTPLFSEPVQVRMNVLKRIDRFKTDAKTEEPFSIRLADGSRLYGIITGLDAKTLSVKSARFGTLNIDRSAVNSVQRLKAGGMLFAAPTSTNGWTESDVEDNGQKKTKLWRVVPGAALTQVGWNHSASLPVDAPELVELHVTLSSSTRPEFKLELKAANKERMIVETWVDEVVLQGRVFQKLLTLADDERRITLTMFWNRTTGLCAIYGADGRKLAETTKPPVDEKTVEKKAEEKKPAPRAGGGGLFGALFGVVQGAAQARVDAAARVQINSGPNSEENKPAGFTLLNKGPDLTLEALRIREWNGTLPDDITTTTGPRVELTSGRFLKATAMRATATTLTVRDDGGKETSLAWDKVLAIELNSTPSAFFQAALPNTEMWFTDGEWVKGTLQHMRKETAVLKTAWSAEPVSFKITTLHHLEFKGMEDAGSKTSFAALDTLTVNKQVLHGTLAAAGEAQPRWQLVGGMNAAAMVSAGEVEIVRAPAAQPEGIRSEALFYLNNGDVVPGTLRAIDAKQVDLDSDVAALKHLPADKLQAIQFGGAALNLNGFEDPGWRRVRGGPDLVKLNGKNALDFLPGGSWGHPAFLQVNEINFTLVNNGFSALRVRLFCDGVDAVSKSTNLLFGHMGSEVCFGLEASGDQMDRQFRLRSNGPMPMRISIAENSIEVFFNGLSVRKIVLTPQMRSGGGIIIEPFSLWGNGEREVKINSFSARIAPGRVAVPVVDVKAREHALTVPRFRKEDPPRHVLLAANGDLLRGVIESATAKHFAIRSGMETIQVPRDRVKAAVWLIKPADDVSAAFEAGARAADPVATTHWLQLNNGARLALKVARFDKEAVIGMNALLGDCRVPLNQIHIIRSSSPQDSAAMMALRDWKLKFAPEPVLPESGGQSSPLLNKEAKPFKLPLLAGGDFDLAQEKGKVIVLDFWATWCGPCIKSLPDMIDQMAAFDPKKVRFIGVNQAESKEAVKSFLETRGWKFEVALDANQRIGQSFGVEGIPHTIVIGPDGKVAYVKTGYEPDGAKKIAETVRKLLGE